MNTLEKVKDNKDKKIKGKLPFAVFICPKSDISELDDYKQVFTDIISDRIKEKYKQRSKNKNSQKVLKKF